MSGKLIQSSYKVHTKLIQSSYKAHTKLIQRSYKAHTKLIQSSYKAHTKLIQSSYKAHTKLRRCKDFGRMVHNKEESSTEACWTGVVKINVLMTKEKGT